MTAPDTTRAVRVHRTGGPEVLVTEDIPLAPPGAGEVTLRHEAVGLNFIDLYHRTGLYPLPVLPHVLGVEGAGVIEAAGPGTDPALVGRRVAYMCYPAGAYCDRRTIAADRLVPVPDDVPFDVAAAGLGRGLTAHYLLHRIVSLAPGDPVLIHAAAGGVGSLLCQWGRHMGLQVIGTVGSPAKAEVARTLGCDVVIDYRTEDVAARVRAATGGRGVRIVLDSVGQDTYAASVDSLARFGTLVNYGNASGMVRSVDARELTVKGSLFFTHPSVFHYTEDRAELLAGARAFFAMLSAGHLSVHIGQRYDLTEAAAAQEDLAARRTTGCSVLTL